MVNIWLIQCSAPEGRLMIVRNKEPEENNCYVKIFYIDTLYEYCKMNRFYKRFIVDGDISVILVGPTFHSS